MICFSAMIVLPSLAPFMWSGAGYAAVKAILAAWEILMTAA